MSIEYRVGDVAERLAEIPDNSIDLVVTSPPFLALRSYLPDDHPDKHKEIGSEPTPAAFIDTLLGLTAEFDRVLAPHGSICIELGDTYSGSGGGGGDYLPGGLREDQPGFGGSAEKQREGNAAHWRAKARNRDAWPLTKSLTGIPTLYTWSLAYGRNLLTGQQSPAGQWRIRNVIVWARPNPPVGALGDKFRPATSYITVACKGPRRYFDLDAVRTEPSQDPSTYSGNGYTKGKPEGTSGVKVTPMAGNPAGAPPLDWHADNHPEDGDWLWKLSTQPYKGSHYATFPMTLPKRLIEAMCPQRVCTICGKPSERIVETFTLDSYRATDRPQTVRAVALADEHGLTDEHIAAIRAFGTSDAGKAMVINNGAGTNSERVKTLAAEAKDVLGGYFREFVMTTNVTRSSGWTDCGHNAWRTGVTLDPFAGSGTTLEAAQAVGRHAIGIDIDHRNAQLAQQRVGMFLTVDEPAA